MLHPPLLCVGSCAGRETCSRAWRKTRHSSPGLHLRPGPRTGEEEQEEQTVCRVTDRKETGKSKGLVGENVKKVMQELKSEFESVSHLEAVFKKERLKIQLLTGYMNLNL